MTTHFPSYSYVKDSVENVPTMNVRKNIIAGPGKREYWNHSPGLSRPDVREEQPFPIQGNIGSLIKQEGKNDYANCSFDKSVSGGPNCVGVFNSDIYSEVNSCGANCKMDGPESYGIQNFGIVDEIGTNMHGLHAYKNVRAGAEGQGPSNVYGCYEMVPNLNKTQGNTCEIDYSIFASNTVSDWTKLPEFKNLRASNFRSF